jgi:hypothetical protein
VRQGEHALEEPVQREGRADVEVELDSLCRVVPPAMRGAGRDDDFLAGSVGSLRACHASREPAGDDVEALFDHGMHVLRRSDAVRCEKDASLEVLSVALRPGDVKLDPFAGAWVLDRVACACH